MAPTVRIKRDRGKGERGFILLVVLIFAALLASLLSSVLRASLSYSYAAAAYSDVLRADELGRSAANLVAQRALSKDPDARRGGAFVVRLPDAEVSVEYISESARVDINSTQSELLVALIKDTGIDADEAQAIGARISSWLAKANPQSAEAPPAQNPAVPSSQPQAANSTTPDPQKMQIRLEDVSQIMSAWGISRDVYDRIAPYLTVSNPSGKIDPVLADPLIIKAVFANDDEAAATYLGKRANGFATESDALMSIPLGARGYVGFSPGVAFRAWVRVELHGRVARDYEMVVVPPRRRSDRVRVTDWQML